MKGECDVPQGGSGSTLIFDESYFFLVVVDVDSWLSKVAVPFKDVETITTRPKGTRQEQVAAVYQVAKEEEAMVPLSIRNRLTKYEQGKGRTGQELLDLHIWGKKRSLPLNFVLSGAEIS